MRRRRWITWWWLVALDGVVRSRGQSEAPKGYQWEIEVTDDMVGDSTSVASMAYDEASDSVYIIGNVGSFACWLGVLNLQTQQLTEQLFVSPSYDGMNDDTIIHVCSDIIVTDASNVLVIGHSTVGDEPVQLDIASNTESETAQINGMVWNLQRVDIVSPQTAPSTLNERSHAAQSNIFDRSSRRLADTFGLSHDRRKDGSGFLNDSAKPDSVGDYNGDTVMPHPRDLQRFLNDENEAIINRKTFTVVSVAPTNAPSESVSDEGTSVPSNVTNDDPPTLAPSTDVPATMTPTLDGSGANGTTMPPTLEPDNSTMVPTNVPNDTFTMEPSDNFDNQTTAPTSMPTIIDGNSTTTAPSVERGNETLTPTVTASSLSPNETDVPTTPAPSMDNANETLVPTMVPSMVENTTTPTMMPSSAVTNALATASPSPLPTVRPSGQPTATVTSLPPSPLPSTLPPSLVPTSDAPTRAPSNSPTLSPSNSPTLAPTPPLQPEEDPVAFVLESGRQLNGDFNVLPLFLTNDDDFAYIASLETNRTSTSFVGSVASRLQNTLSDDAASFYLTVSALPILTDSPELGMGTQLGSPVWQNRLNPLGKESVISLGGIVRKDNALFIGGSVEESSNDGVDGFVLKVFKETGNPFGNDPATAGLVSSYRISSESGMDDFVSGICSSDSLSIFVTGFTKDGLNGSENHAFLMKFRALDLTPMWTVKLPANGEEVQGLSCAITPDGDLYFAGNVLNGGAVSDSGIASSFGGTDIFVAKVDEGSGELVFVRQLGSPMDDVIAPGGGVIVNSDGDAVVVGGSNGAVFQRQTGTSEPEQHEVFLAVVAKDGSVPLTIFTPPPLTTLAPTANTSSLGTLASPRQEFAFTALTIRLEGAKPLTSESRLDFESAMEDFYLEFYAEADRPRLQTSDVSAFSTSVATVGERPDDLGNEIRYDQTISFVAEDRNFTEDDAKDILIAPFAFGFTKDIFVDLLRSSNSDFQSVNSVGELDFPLPGNPSVVGPGSDEGSSSGMADVISDNFLYIAIAGGSICLIGGAIYFRRRRAMKRKAEKEISRPTTGAPLVPLEESRPGLQRRPSRAKRPGDYSAAYLKGLDDFGQGNNTDFGGFNQSFDSDEYSAHSEQQFNSSHEKIRVNLPQTRARSRSREILRRSRDDSSSGDSYGTDTESGNDDDFYDEEMPTPKKSVMIADFEGDDDGGDDDDFSESYNSFLDKFQEEAQQNEFPNGPDLEEASLPASVQSNLNPEAQSRLRERKSRRSRRRTDSVEDSFSNSTSSHRRSDESDSDSNSDPHIKVRKEADDMSSFTAEELADDWVRGM